MAYSGANLSIMTQTVEGSFKLFFYASTDSLATVVSANYFADGVERGMQVGDFVFALVAGVPYMLFVASNVGNACTVTGVTVALVNGNTFPTTNPGPGTGLIWNNGDFLCVA